MNRGAAVTTQQTAVIPGVTCDYEGKPMEITQIKKFPKKLLNEAGIKVHEEPAKVVQSPEKIKSIMS